MLLSFFIITDMQFYLTKFYLYAILISSYKNINKDVIEYNDILINIK